MSDTLSSESAGNKRRILVTSALPYANGSIHLGHLLEHIQTDIWARFQRLRGNECFAVCADDAHGTPVMLKAQELGITPEEMVERTRTEHHQDLKDFHVSYDNYYVTHSPENKTLCEMIYTRLDDAGYISKRVINQLYDPQKEMFLPDRFVKGTCPSCGAEDQNGDSCDVCGATYSPTEVKNPRSVVSGATPVLKESEHFFFDLPQFEGMLKEWIRSGALQEEMANKLQEWFEEGLQQWDISRDAPYFGFEIPDSPGNYWYVWFDAPIGYMASTRQWCAANGEDFDTWWRDPETEVHHFIGKDITYFHTLFWPAMLKTAKFNLPTKVHIHGFLTVDGRKMSKSEGTFVQASTYLEHLNPVWLRYYYATKLGPRLDDLDLNLDVQVEDDDEGVVFEGEDEVEDDEPMRRPVPSTDTPRAAPQIRAKGLEAKKPQQLTYSSPGEPGSDRVDVVFRNRFNPNLTARWFSSVMQLMNNVTVLMLILSGASLIRERERDACFRAFLNNFWSGLLLFAVRSRDEVDQPPLLVGRLGGVVPLPRERFPRRPVRRQPEGYRGDH